MTTTHRYIVRVYTDGANRPATRTRTYATWVQAQRYQDAQVRRGIVAVAERRDATPPASHWRG